MDNLKAFIRYLLPDVDEDVSRNIDPRLTRRLDKLLEAEGLSVNELIAQLDWTRVNLPEVIHLSKSEMLKASRPIAPYTEPPARNRFDFKLLAMASFTLAAVMAGAVASSKMKKRYDDLIDSANAGFPAPEWKDDAPDKDDVIPFYNTDTIDALIRGFNSMRAKAAAYLKEYTKKSTDSGYRKSLLKIIKIE